ncbi:hypothetical protein LCGC14_2493900 [marine sediment metagenome]|uniref:2-isopropylmalate synthase LeuA allosteric (dimerisation) domain-containing protein n=1 Tax=marine sediment metagenome TaxID=412755 RepID=A0A0F9B4L7_9ZZZZ
MTMTVYAQIHRLTKEKREDPRQFECLISITHPDGDAGPAVKHGDTPMKALRNALAYLEEFVSEEEKLQFA